MKLCLALLFGASVTLAPLYAENQSAEKTASVSAFDTSKVNIKGIVEPGKVNFAPGEEMTFVISIDVFMVTVLSGAISELPFSVFPSSPVRVQLK